MMLLYTGRISWLVIFIVVIAEAGTIAAQSRKTPNVSSSKAEKYSDLIEQVHLQVNEFRRQQGLAPLTLEPIISAQAREHSAEMAETGKTISHRDFKERLQAIRKEIPFRAAAENVAANDGYENPAQKAVTGWKNSPGHRKNMLGDFHLTGIGIAQSSKGTYFFTQIFVKGLN